MAGRTVFLLILVFSTTTTATVAVHDEGDKDRWIAHTKTVAQFECGRPQRRSIDARDLPGDNFQTSESVIPQNTVLHRCDSGSGCCNERLTACAVAAAANVTLDFYVRDDIKNTEGYRVVTVTNHTLCSCQARKDTIK